MTKVMDRGYSWVICGVTFSSYFFHMMGLAAFGILFSEFVEHFSSSNAQAALIGSLNSAVGAVSGLLLNPIIPKFGCRPIAVAGALIGAIGYAGCFFAQSILHLCIGFGILSGFANGMIFFSSTLILHRYFDQRRTLAAAIATCGISTATLTIPPITRWLISCLGWRTTTLVIGAIFLQSAICGALMRPNDDNNNHKPMANDEKSGEVVHSSAGCCSSLIRGATWLAKSIWTSLDVTILCNLRFPIFITGSCLSVFGYIVPCVFIPILAVTSFDMSPSTSAFLLSIWAVSTIIGRISSGIVGDRISFFKRPGRRIYIYAVPNIFAGLLTASVYGIRSHPAFLIYVILFGFMTGSYVSAQQPVMVDLFGLADFSKILAFFLLFTGVAIFLCQPFAGWLVDMSGSFRLAFLANGLIQAFSGFLLLALVLIGPSKSKKAQNKISETDVEPAIVTSSVIDSKLMINSYSKDGSINSCSVRAGMICDVNRL